MSVPTKNIRGVQSIRTYSGKVDQIGHSYKAYMRISCLEMEKYRRGQERESAMHRVNNIDERFRQIEVEKAALMQTLGQTESGKAVKPNIGPNRGKGGFRVRY